MFDNILKCIFRKKLRETKCLEVMMKVINSDNGWMDGWMNGWMDGWMDG